MQICSTEPIARSYGPAFLSIGVLHIQYVSVSVAAPARSRQVPNALIAASILSMIQPPIGNSLTSFVPPECEKLLTFPHSILLTLVQVSQFGNFFDPEQN